MFPETIKTECKNNDNNSCKEIKKNNNTKIFNLFRANVDLFPNDIFKLIDLVEIDIQFTEITNIPNEIENLYLLQRLCLSHNKIVSTGNFIY